MKQRLTKLFSLALALSMTLSLTACGGSGKSDDSGKTPAPAAESAYRDVTFSEYLSSGETIWYDIGGYAGKDTYVRQIFVLEPDGSLYRADGGEAASLGQLEQMEDADIVAMVKEGHNKAAFNGCDAYLTAELAEVKQWLNLNDVFLSLVYKGEIPKEVLQENHIPASAAELIMECADELRSLVGDDSEGVDMALAEGLIYQGILELPDKVEDELFEVLGAYVIEDNLLWEWGQNDGSIAKAVAAAKLIYDTGNAVAEAALDNIRNFEPEPGQYKLALTTDQTGNEISGLVFAYQIPTIDGIEEDWFPLSHISPAAGAATNCENLVYDSTYGGFNTMNGAFFTRIDSSFNFVLEQIGESDLPIDVKPEELFQ